jgi:putative hemolysin
MANLPRSDGVQSLRSSAHRSLAELPARGYVVALAQNQDEIRESQRLRFQVFAQEMGATLKSAADGLDYDRFDEYCKHLIVRDLQTGEVVASTRVLLDADARKAGGYYSEGEFDMQPLIARCGPIMEIGRTCVHTDYRRGAAIAVLWSGLAKYFDLHEYSRMIGCASIPMKDGGSEALAAYQWLVQHNLVIHSFGVMPRLPLPMVAVLPPAPMLPPLLKAYVRLGARICGTPCWDPDFNSADLLVVLDPKEIRSRYAKHFLNRAC